MFKAVVGLGNFGEIYQNTRHNIGFRFIDFLGSKFDQSPWKHEKKLGVFIKKIEFKPGENLLLIKTDGFMNQTGTPLQKVCSFFKITSSEIVILCDDITLPLSRVKISEKPGTAGHNGVSDILSKIGPGFIRFRIGIDSKPFKSMDLADYVLGKFSPQELDILSKNEQNILNDLNLLLDKGVLYAMNSVNRKV